MASAEPVGGPAPSATEQVVAMVRAMMATRRVSAADRAAVAELVAEAVESYRRQAAVGAAVPLVNPRDLTARVVRSICDYGALTHSILRDDNEEVIVEDDRIVDIVGGRFHAVAEPSTLEENLAVIQRLLAETNQALSEATPIVTAQVLAGTARLTAAVHPVVNGLSATIRKYARQAVRMSWVCERDGISPAAANFCTLGMWAKRSFVVSGEAGAGKTTLAGAVLNAARDNHVVRLMEDHPEIILIGPLARAYRTKPPGPDGGGEVSLRDLVRFNLRMRPDVVGIGEVRGAEAWDLLRAARQGAGFLTTVHSGSAPEALETLVTCALAAPEANERHVRKSLRETVHIIVHVERDDPNLVRPGHPYRRQVTEICTMAPAVGAAGEFSTDPIFVRKALGAPLVYTGVEVHERVAQHLQRCLPPRVKLHDVLTGRAGLR